MLANSGWTAAPYSGSVTQITGYNCIDQPCRFAKRRAGSSGNYALGKDINATWLNGVRSDRCSAGRALQWTVRWHGPRDRQSDHVPGVGATHATGLFAVIGDHGVVRNISVTNATIPSTGGYRILRVSPRKSSAGSYTFTSAVSPTLTSPTTTATPTAVSWASTTARLSTRPAVHRCTRLAQLEVSWAGITGLSSSRLRTARLPDAANPPLRRHRGTRRERFSPRVAVVQLVLQRTPDSVLGSGPAFPGPIVRSQPRSRPGPGLLAPHMAAASPFTIWVPSITTSGTRT